MVCYLWKLRSYLQSKPGRRLTSGAGSYKQYIKSPERYTTTIPDGVSDYIAGPVMCSASTIYTSLKNAALKPGEWAVFPGGGGGVGIQGVQLAEAVGLRPIVVDTGDDKEKLAKSLGAEHFLDFRKIDDVAAEILKITDGIGAHGVFVTAPQSYGKAISYLGSRCGGKVRSCSPISAPVALLTVFSGDVHCSSDRWNQQREWHQLNRSFGPWLNMTRLRSSPPKWFSGSSPYKGRSSAAWQTWPRHWTLRSEVCRVALFVVESC